MKINVKQGEIYRVGDHVLACGSSTEKEFVEEVVKQGKVPEIRTILTDPPYGVAYVEGKKAFSKLGVENAKIIVGDQIQTEEEYERFTAKWLDAIKNHLASYNACYIFNSDTMFSALRNGMKKSEFYYSQMLVWVKNTVVVGRKDYLPMHEIIAYGWYGRHKMERSKAKSVMFHPKPARSKLHPTMKPIGLLRKILPNSTKMGEWVYDPFGGSGSTLIACEHMGRKCLAIELDPQYCSIIMQRFEKLTGKEAKKII